MACRTRKLSVVHLDYSLQRMQVSLSRAHGDKDSERIDV